MRLLLGVQSLSIANTYNLALFHSHRKSTIDPTCFWTLPNGKNWQVFEQNNEIIKWSEKVKSEKQQLK